MSFLSREQENKKVFLQLGRRFHLPIDIITFLYKLNQIHIKEEIQTHINHYKSTYTLNICLERNQDLTKKCVINLIGGVPSGNLLEPMIKKSKRLREIDIYSMGWVDLQTWRIDPLDGDFSSSPIQTNRDSLLRQVEILGDSSFLLKENVYSEGPYQGEYYYSSLSYKEKVSLMKKHSIEILNIYEEYLRKFGRLSGFNIIVLDNNKWIVKLTNDIEN